MIFTLQRPGIPLRAVEPQFFLGRVRGGDSHLQITKPVSQRQTSDTSTIELGTIGASFQMKFIGHPNDDGYLGRIEVELEAQTLNDAQHRAHRALAWVLSTLSTQFDVPLYIYQIDSIELTTSRIASIFTVPFPEKALPTGGVRMTTPEFRFYASLYREALCSNSLIYQFLCLYKIIEGIRRRRTRLGMEAKKRKERLIRPAEVSPSDPAQCLLWLEGLFPNTYGFRDIDLDRIVLPQVRGRKFGSILDQHLGPLRNAIAHSLSADPKELRLLADELLHLEEVEKWLSLTRCIVRQMLKNEFPTEFAGEVSGSAQTPPPHGQMPVSR